MIQIVKKLIRIISLTVVPLFFLYFLYLKCDCSIKDFMIVICFYTAMIIIAQLIIWAWSDY